MSRDSANPGMVSAVGQFICDKEERERETVGGQLSLSSLAKELETI